MRISARADYAIRAVIEIASKDPELVKSEAVSAAQGIPPKFLENILSDLRRAGIVKSKRGAEGGYLLGFDAADISLAHIIRSVDGPLAWVRDERPGAVTYTGSADGLQEVWIAVRASLRAVLDHTSVAHVVNGEMPKQVTRWTQDPQAWVD